MTALHTPWQKVQHYFWLVCGVCCLFAALIFWAITDSDAVIEVEKKPETKVQLQVQPEKVATMTHNFAAPNLLMRRKNSMRLNYFASVMKPF